MDDEPCNAAAGEGVGRFAVIVLGTFAAFGLLQVRLALGDFEPTQVSGIATKGQLGPGFGGGAMPDWSGESRAKLKPVSLVDPKKLERQISEFLQRTASEADDIETVGRACSNGRARGHLHLAAKRIGGAVNITITKSTVDHEVSDCVERVLRGLWADSSKFDEWDVRFGRTVKADFAKFRENSYSKSAH